MVRQRVIFVIAALAFIGWTAVGAFAQGGGGGGGADDRLQRTFNQDDLVRILQSEGYGSVEKRDSNAVMFKVDGKIYGMFIFDDNDLQMYYGTSGIDVKLETINKWNKDFRHSRAYIDDEGDPILEADILADKGLSEAMVKNFVSTFISSVRRFRTDVLRE